MRGVIAAHSAIRTGGFDDYLKVGYPDSSMSSIEAHYGLTRDDGSHKLAFEVARQ